MKIQSPPPQGPPQSPATARKKIGTQDYPANPALDEWAKSSEFQNVPQFFRMAVQKNPDGQYVGARVNGKGDYQFQTYKEVEKHSEEFASGLVELGVKPTDRVGVYAENSPEWRTADFGIADAAGILTCMLADYNDQRVEFVLQDSGSKLCIVDTKDRLDKVLKAEGNLPALETIIVTGDVDLSQVKSTKKLMSYKDVLNLGAGTLEKNKPEIEKRISEIRYDDIGSIVYTSGSTGNPKGVLLSHGNVLASVEGMLRRVNDNPGETLRAARRDDVYPSILPLGHVMGRVADFTMTAEGGKIAYPAGLIGFTKDLKELKPSVLAITPLFLHKIYDNVANKALTQDSNAIPPFVAGLAAGAGGAALGGTAGALLGGALGGTALQWGLGIAGAALLGAAADRWATDKATNLSQAELFSGSLENSKAYYESHGSYKVSQRIKHVLAEKFVFSKVKDQVDTRLGGNVRLMISGGAPLSGEAESLLRASGYGISQGYGLAETSAGGLMNNPAHAELGTGGSASPGSKVRLSEEGEIQISGPTVMTGGYLNRDDKTKESFTDDGWYRTGDKGKLVKTHQTISVPRLAGFTAAGTVAGAVAGHLLHHPVAGALVGTAVAGLGTIFSGIARPEGEDHFIISGRIKSQFKLPGGEYVTPEPIEASLQGSPFIQRAMVCGGKEKDLVGALIQPNFEYLTKYCKDKGLTTDPKEMVKLPEIVAIYEKEAQERSTQFQKHEVVRRVSLLDHELTGDEVTNKGEIMRSNCTAHYEQQIKDMFA